MTINGGVLNGAPINGASVEAPPYDGPPIVGGVKLLQLGAPKLQIGQDLALTPPGMDLIKWDFHTAVVGVILPSAGATTAGGVNLLELGSPIFAPAPASTEAGAADLLELGDHSIGVALIAGDAELLELGAPGPVGYATTAGDAQLLELGAHGVGMAFTVQGMDLLKWGVHTALVGGTFTVAGGVDLFELGSPGALGYAATARSANLLQLGSPSIGRGNTC